MSARAWLLASRPQTLTAAVVPVAVGTAVADVAGSAKLGPALAALLGAMFIQIGTNFANDVFDFENGADTAARLGPVRAVAAGMITPAAMRLAMIAAFALATLCGVYLTAIAGWPVVAIGVASVASGIAYTGGPFPLGYHGLGDVFVFVFFGLVAVCGTTFVQLGSVPALAWWAAIPVGALATAILVVNNVRDRRTDVVARKKTLAVRFGRRVALAQYLALIAAAYATPLVISAMVGSPLVLLPLLSMPLALACVRGVLTADGAALNPYLARTAQLLAIHGLLLAGGLWLSAS